MRDRGFIAGIRLAAAVAVALMPGVARAQLVLPDLEGAPGQRLGLAVAPLRLVQQRQAVEGGGDVGVALAQPVLDGFSR